MKTTKTRRLNDVTAWTEMSLVKAILAVKRPQTDDTTDRLTAVCVCLAGQDRSDICHSVLVVAAATLAEFASVMAV